MAYNQPHYLQIDVRVLKAVAIEHSKDADSAADYILMEVLPRLSQQSVSSPRQTPSSGSPKYRSLRVHRDVDEGDTTVGFLFLIKLLFCTFICVYYLFILF